jgi:hypothetical protein
MKLASSIIEHIRLRPIASELREPYAIVIPSGNINIESILFLRGKYFSKYGELSIQDLIEPKPVASAVSLLIEK